MLQLSVAIHHSQLTIHKLHLFLLQLFVTYVTIIWVFFLEYCYSIKKAVMYGLPGRTF